MSILKDYARQCAVVAKQAIALVDFAVDLVQGAVQLPAGAIVIGGFLVVDEVFDAVTTATIAVGDSLSAARYLAATNVKAAGYTALVPTGYQTLTQGDVLVTYAFTGAAATTGKARLVIEYIVDGKSEFTQG